MNHTAKISIIGSGNVASHLGPALQMAGFTLAAVCSPTLAHAEALADLLGGIAAVDQVEQLPISDIYLLCVKDKVLTEVAQRLADSLTPEQRNAAFVVHTAGSISLEVLASHFPHAAVMYPLQTFSKGASFKFSQVPLFVEGSTDNDLCAVTALAERLSHNVTPLSSEKRKRLHLAGVFANNFANHCVTLAAEILAPTDVSSDVLLPMLEETMRKLQHMPPAKAQTGPASRWDTNVMADHMAMLAQEPELQSVYRIMSESIHHYNEDQ